MTNLINRTQIPFLDLLLLSKPNPTLLGRKDAPVSWIWSPITEFCCPNSISPCLGTAGEGSSLGWSHSRGFWPPCRDFCGHRGYVVPLGSYLSLGTGYQSRYTLLSGNFYNSFTHKSSDMLKQTQVVFHSSFICCQWRFQQNWERGHVCPLTCWLPFVHSSVPPAKPPRACLPMPQIVYPSPAHLALSTDPRDFYRK